MAVDNKHRYLTAATPCPICHGYDRSKVKGERCWGYGTDGWAHCTRAEYAGSLPMGNDGAYAHKLEGTCKCGRSHGEWVPVPVFRPLASDQNRNQPQDAPVWVRDAVYKRYLELCPLRPEHLAAYARRGEVDQMVAQAYGYGSLPRGRDEAQRVVAALIREFGEHTLLSVPGFWAQKGGRPTTHTGSATDDSAVIPCRDHHGKLIALVRHTMAGDAAKYRNFSGSQQVHTVAPGGVFGPVYIVEGIHKAYVAAEAGGLPALGLAGAALTDAALATLAAMDTQDGLVVALDAPDVRNNRHIRDAHAKLLSRLTDYPAVQVADWPDAHGKGLDDIIKAGHWPTLRPLPGPDDEEAEEGTPPDPDARTKALANERTGRFRARRASPWAPGVLRPYDLSDALDNDTLAGLVESAVLATAPPSAQDKAWELNNRAEKSAQRAQHCGGIVAMKCKAGHEQGPRGYTCQEGACPKCGSRTGISIAYSDGLDDLTGDAHYAHIELLLPVAHDGVDYEGDYVTARKRWQAAVAKLGGRKAWHGRILWRSVAGAQLARTSSTLSLRVAVRVDSAADAQIFADDLWGLLPEALPSDPALTQAGEAIIDQAIEDASMTVLSMADPGDTELYVQWCLATKGYHLFQSLAVFAKTVRAAAKALAADKLVCEVAGCMAHVYAERYHPRTAYVELEAAFRAKAAAPPKARPREAVRA